MFSKAFDDVDVYKLFSLTSASDIKVSSWPALPPLCFTCTDPMGVGTDVGTPATGAGCVGSTPIDSVVVRERHVSGGGGGGTADASPSSGVTCLGFISGALAAPARVDAELSGAGCGAAGPAAGPGPICGYREGGGPTAGGGGGRAADPSSSALMAGSFFLGLNCVMLLCLCALWLRWCLFQIRTAACEAESVIRAMASGTQTPFYAIIQ